MGLYSNRLPSIIVDIIQLETQFYSITIASPFRDASGTCFDIQKLQQAYLLTQPSESSMSINHKSTLYMSKSFYFNLSSPDRTILKPGRGKFEKVGDYKLLRKGASDNELLFNC